MLVGKRQGHGVEWAMQQRTLDGSVSVNMVERFFDIHKPKHTGLSAETSAALESNWWKLLYEHHQGQSELQTCIPIFLSRHLQKL